MPRAVMLANPSAGGFQQSDRADELVPVDHLARFVAELGVEIDGRLLGETPTVFDCG